MLNRHLSFQIATIIALLILSAPHAFAQRAWSSDLLVGAGPGDQIGTQVISDNNKGAYISWWDRLTATIRLQRVSADGKRIWLSPARVAPDEWQKFNPAIVGDGSNGVIVAWIESRTEICNKYAKANCDIYIQHLSSAGTRLWGFRGSPVSRAEANQGTSGIALVADGHGGAFLAWEDARPECCQVYAQHIDSNGQSLWNVDGIKISSEPLSTAGPMWGPPRMVSDGMGGVIISWIDSRITAPNLRVQRVTSEGKALWTRRGNPVGQPSHVHFTMASDGNGGALLAYAVRGVRGIHDIAVQDVSSNGEGQWGSNGAVAASSTYYASAPDVISDGLRGAIVVWVDHLYTSVFGESNILAQRLGPAGERLWNPNGKVISNLPGQQDSARIISITPFEALMVWRDCRDYTTSRDNCFDNADIYGQSIFRGGAVKWQFQGIPLVKARGAQALPQGTPEHGSFIDMATDGQGGAIMAWPDGRRAFCQNSIVMSECDIFAQRINAKVLP